MEKLFENSTNDIKLIIINKEVFFKLYGCRINHPR